MQIQTHVGRGIDTRSDLVGRIEEDVTDGLAHFVRRLTRVEVHLQDQSAGRATGDDIRCTLEARSAGTEPVSVTDDASTAEDAVAGAVTRMQSVLRSAFGRIDDRDRIRAAIGGALPGPRR